MTKIKVAVLSGGDSAERVISERSALVVYKYLDPSTFDARIIDIQGSQWTDLNSGTPIDKNTFSLNLENEGIWVPDVAFCAIHGAPMENGVIQGYFEILGIPYTNCDGFVSALTMNKYLTKKSVLDLRVPMAKDQYFSREDYDQGNIQPENLVEYLGLPLFIKPNNNGSSFGVTKVKNVDEVEEALRSAFEYSDEILAESFLSGAEFGNGVLSVNGQIIALPVTEIIPETEFFDFAAKYEGKSVEITPAKISDEDRDQIQSMSKQLYSFLKCKGFVRFDYIRHDGKYCLLEVNTVPGLSEASIIPQQAVAHGWTLNEFFAHVVHEAIRQNQTQS